MKPRHALAAAGALFIGTTGMARAEPLTADELARCASQVQRLQQESARLTAVAQRHDALRTELGEEMQAIGDSETRRAQYNARATAFNEEVQAFARELAEINRVKADYAEQCANRQYRQTDLEALPAEQQEAMRAGLDGVLVPYDGRAAAE